MNISLNWGQPECSEKDYEQQTSRNRSIKTSTDFDRTCSRFRRGHEARLSWPARPAPFSAETVAKDVEPVESVRRTWPEHDSARTTSRPRPLLCHSRFFRGK